MELKKKKRGLPRRITAFCDVWHGSCSRSRYPTHALNMLHAHVVIVTTHYTIFVLPRLLICLTKHTFGLALFLPGQNPGSERGMPMASLTLRTGTKRAVFMSLDTRGYIRKYCHWTKLWEEYLCRRTHLSPLHGTVQKNHKKKTESYLEVDHTRPRRTMNTAQSSAVFMSMDTRGYIEFHHQWTGEE